MSSATMPSDDAFFSPGGMVLSPHSTTAEFDMGWNPAQVVTDLHHSSQILTDRCLKLSAKWAVEQWMGLPPDVVESGGTGEPSLNIAAIVEEDQKKTPLPQVYYARTLMELGEYSHAAAVLSQTSLTNKAASVESMPPPQSDLSPKGVFYRAYALYMAGEKRKEEEAIESEGKKKHAKNPYLQQLLHELQDAYEQDILDAFGLHVYGMVLLAGKRGVLPQGHPSAAKVLIQSILQFPYNWSAWLDLAETTLDDREAERTIEEDLQPILGANFMYHFFCAHLQVERQHHGEAKQIYERWLDPNQFAGSPYLLTQHAICSYHTREFADAKSLLQDLHRHNPYRLDSMDVYSNILYVQEDAVALSQLAHIAVQVDKYRAETCCIVGNYYSLKQQRAKAIQYFQRALKMDPSFTSAWTLMGHEYVEWKQTANAMEAYRRAVQVDPFDFRAWYGLGQTYELLNMDLYALYYYKKAAQLRPYDARMWCAVGTMYAQLHRTEDAIRAYERALQEDESEGVATQSLAKLYRQGGDEEKAAKCYMRHLEIRRGATNSNDASHTGREHFEKMLQSIFVESTEAEAILFLANYFLRNREFNIASACCSRLLDYPGPEKEQAKAIQREIRTRQTGGGLSLNRTFLSRSQVPNDSFEFSP